MAGIAVAGDDEVGEFAFRLGARQVAGGIDDDSDTHHFPPVGMLRPDRQPEMAWVRPGAFGSPDTNPTGC